MFLTLSFLQFDMLLGRLEKDGSRKVGKLRFSSLDLLLSSLLWHFSSASLSLFVSALCGGFSQSDMDRYLPLLQHVSYMFSRSPFSSTLFHCHGSKSSSRCFIVAFASKASWHFSPCLQHTARCDVRRSFIPLKFTPLCVSSPPTRQTHSINCVVRVYILSDREVHYSIYNYWADDVKFIWQWWFIVLYIQLSL